MRHRDLVTGILGIWLVAAVLGDGWAHFNVPELESFFTPWHGVLYAALATTAAWMGLLVWRTRQPGRPVFGGLPRGYAGGVLGVIVFGVGGVADLLWHEFFGIEVAVDALVSPSHLLLGAGGLLILGTPLRAQGVLREDRPWTPTAVLSLVLSTALVAFFLLYTSPFPMPAVVEAFVPTPEGSPGHLEAELPVVAGLGGYLLTTVLFTVPLLLILRGGRRLPGVATVLVAPVALLSVAVVGFPTTSLVGAAGAAAGAVVADLVLARIPDGFLPVAAGGVAVLVWAGQLTGLAISDAVRWPVSLWSGVVVLGGFTAAALGFLAKRS
ncbi:hypothetical protein [Lentzea nigeriaca]|uniref:hypothetical protein n=1 Tax=Lentzea nigeriaca TaxID=1128665 RepID=UPI0019578921|nr:hypothetical protein [Lentzea nigeriaca]MBM7860702.1 hypothetical protein [Lentzea nigeriaca]